eukprot:TRINITY_DN17383_c0_g1_i1.p1 TRINITY_DN17383_c0_g1~~TRINITY_DN17383_c0_g1_i1.p1  ORF type:complete len:239 (-),score=55.36 TRINITY_DN17383_c0_g1_i1:404-1120(-)
MSISSKHSSLRKMPKPNVYVEEGYSGNDEEEDEEEEEDSNYEDEYASDKRQNHTSNGKSTKKRGGHAAHSGKKSSGVNRERESITSVKSSSKAYKRFSNNKKQKIATEENEETFHDYSTSYSSNVKTEHVETSRSTATPVKSLRVLSTNSATNNNQSSANSKHGGSASSASTTHTYAFRTPHNRQHVANLVKGGKKDNDLTPSPPTNKYTGRKNKGQHHKLYEDEYYETSWGKSKKKQ